MVQLSAGQSFAEYTLDGMLGQGGMGSVYLAHHPRLPRQVALKLLGQEVSTDPELRKRFEQEANAIARLDHPNIVGIHDRGVHDGHLWIAMQYVQGVDASRLDPRQVSVDRALRIIIETASALDFAHSRGVLHRDVKPANILLSEADTGRDERAILTDFGIARLLDSNTQLTSTGMFTATLAYASPEQLSGEQVDHRADQYSLACTLFTLLAGHPPFASGNPGQVVAAHLSQPLPRLSHIRNDIPPHLDDVIARATAKRREDRFTSCTEFVTAARTVPSGQSASPVSRTPPTVVGHRGSSGTSLALTGDVKQHGSYANFIRVLRGSLGLVAGLVALASFLTLAVKEKWGDSDQWQAWRYVRGDSHGNTPYLHLLGGAFALVVVLAIVAGIFLREQRGTVRWFAVIVSGIAFGVTTTAALDIIAAVRVDENLISGTPGAGFWLLVPAAAVSLVAALIGGVSAIRAAEPAPSSNRNGDFAIGGLLFFAATATLLASFMDLDKIGHTGLPLAVGMSGSGIYELPEALLTGAAVCGLSTALLLMTGRGSRMFARLLATSATAVILGVVITTILESCSQALIYGGQLSFLTDGFWALAVATALSVAAAIASMVAARR
ncbi:serine/threonine-protein kinase [Nocardia sp. NPDC056000]|uniref:serine/threonine-protein kinase n=1 Tax=Nocardia sp. NPDC056000 TaxID=3345674 RepID=UPI0035DF8EF5